ncbi:hypothetical protein ERO13_D01G074900v2 [Gossypium hirsutum]|nr:hypothetical protein ERO13_D01G074900v2 [Gossypium hirsutum]
MTKQTQMTVPRSTRFFRSKDSLDLASTIAELNKEMESVFGEPPPDGLANSGNRSCMAQDAHHNSHVILKLSLEQSNSSQQGMKASIKSLLAEKEELAMCL